MVNLKNENNYLVRILDFKKNKTFVVKSANVVNKGLQPNLLSIIIDRGTADGIKRNLPVLTPKGVVGKTIEIVKTAVLSNLFQMQIFV